MHCALYLVSDLILDHFMLIFEISLELNPVSKLGFDLVLVSWFSMLLHVSWTRFFIWVWPVLACPCKSIKCISVCTALWHVQWYTVHVTLFVCDEFKCKWWRTTQITEANIIFKIHILLFIVKIFLFQFYCVSEFFCRLLRCWIQTGMQLKTKYECEWHVVRLLM